MKQSIYLGEFALAALAGEGERGAGADLPTTVVSAIRLYLNDKDLKRPGWPYPDFLPEKGEGDEVRLELDIEEALWGAFEEEAERQGVSVARLASHVVLYFAAELNSGQLTQRIADDLGDD